MDIDSAKRLKAHTENEIKEMINFFIQKTGLRVNGVDLLTHATIGGEVSVVQVKIRTEI